jgi:O-antigen/teichoic acid export membrane protein
MVVAAAAGVLVQMLLSNTLGTDAFGDYVYALNWVTLLTVGAVLGFEVVIIRYVATYRAAAEWGQFLGLLRYSARMSLVLSVGIGAIVAVAGLLTRSPTLGPVLLAAAPLLPLLTGLRLSVAALQGLKRVALGNLVQAIRPIAMGLALLGSMTLAAWQPEAPGAMLLNVAATALTLGLAAVLLRRILPRELQAASAIDDRATWTRTLGPMTWMTAAQVLLVYTDVLMLGAIIDTREAGIYSVAVQLVTALGFGVAAINAVSAPLMAELHVGRRAETQSLLTRATRGTFGYTLAAGGVLVLVAPWLLGLFGPDFPEGATALYILIAGQVVIGSCGPAGFLPTMTGREREAGRFVVASAIANVVLNAALIPWFGLAGAAVATAMSGGGRSLLMALWVRRQLGYRPGLNLAGRPPAPGDDA